MNKVLYPGTFDPVTNGHMDLIERGRRLFDGVIVGVAAAHHKDGPLFSLEERTEMVRIAVRGMEGVEVLPFEGLLVDFARALGVHAVLRGLRAISDFEFETQMAFMNRRLAPDVEFLFLPADEKVTYLNSSVVKEIARLGGDVSSFVPPPVRERLAARFGGGAG
ncbi:MAG: pantetheine-phosphate adenylyltransferase [Candidatus Eisenbacteria bacterium]|nr:pantetheine-phosphate adenylyltransferase [Candidatus Eisenbacteria bacterium]